MHCPYFLKGKVRIMCKEKINDIIAESKLNELINRKDEKKPNGIVIALAIIGSLAAVAGIAFLVYKLMKPDYLDDFDDDDFDDFDDLDDDDDIIDEK